MQVLRSRMLIIVEVVPMCLFRCVRILHILYAGVCRSWPSPPGGLRLWLHAFPKGKLQLQLQLDQLDRVQE